MFYVGVCDDELTVCEQVRDCLLHFANARGIELNVAVYSDGRSVWQQLEEGKQLHLLFLDIEMAFLNGVELGKRIRGELQNQLIQIVYISGKQQYAMELFEVRPMNFLLKPLKIGRLTAQLELALELCSQQESEIFFYQVERDYGKIAYADILYFESKGRKLRIVTVTGSLECYGTLNDAEKKAPPMHFVRIHKSYLVNDLHVCRWHADEVKLLSGEALRISRSFRKEANMKLLEINKHRGR